jgi:tRNA threonylcarbamoyl adenosine modification protein (Sua5/YciO/YrdC/YwlC family)
MIIIPWNKIMTAANFNKIRDCILADGVIAYPTDTLYGLGGNFFSLALIEKIDRLKNRRDLPYSVAVGSLAMLESLTENIPEIFRRRLCKLLPGKFTFLFATSPVIDTRLLKNSAKIGIRLPGLPPLLHLIEKIGLPLVSTSANRSGQPPLNDPALIASEFPVLDLLLDGGVLPLSKGSTVVDLGAVPPRLVRAGDDVEKYSDLLTGTNPVKTAKSPARGDKNLRK